MVVYDRIFQSAQLQLLVDDLSNKLMDLPVERREPIEEDLQKIRSAVDGLLQTKAQSDLPAIKKTGLFFDNLRDAALVYQMVRDKAGNIQDWYIREANDAALQALGFKREEMIGKTASELFGVELVKQATPELNEIFTKGEASQHEESYRGRHFLVSMFRIDRDIAGRIAVDITERKKTEDDLRVANVLLSTSVAQYRELAESITDPFTAYDANLRIIYRNQASKNATGLPDEQVIGKTFSELYPNLVGGEIHQVYLRTLETRQPQHCLSEWVRPTDGQKFYYDLSLYPNRDGLVAYSKDITRRIRAEEELRENTEALRESEERFRLMGDTLPYGVWWCDPDGRALYASQSFLDLLGMTIEEMQGFGWTQRLPPDEVTPMMDRWMHCVHTGEDWDDEHHVLGPDGKYHAVLTRGKPVHDEQGKITGWVGINLDIDERKRLENDLRKSEERFRGLFEMMQEVFFICKITRDVSGNPIDIRYLEANAACLARAGRKREEMVGHTYLELFPPNPTFDLWLEHFGAVDRSGERDHFELFGEATGLYFEVFAYAPHPGEVAVILTDITERKQAEEAQRESEERERSRANELETLMDAVPSLIWISRDPECHEMFGNRQGYEFLGLGPGSNISKTAPKAALENQQYQYMKDGKLIPPTELPMQIAAATGKPAQEYMFDLVFDDGATYNLMGNVNPLFDQDGKPSGAVGAFTDITRLRHLEAEKVEAKAQIEVQHRLMEYREQERQGIARDLHDGPIQTLAGTAFNLQFIKEAYQDPTLRVELEQVTYNVKSAVRELREIVNDLRPPSLIRFGLAKTVQIHADDIQERHPEIKIEMSLAEDNNQLSEQACLTLFRIYQEGLNNAVRHSGASVVSVVYKIEADAFILELRDNGRGFRVTQDLSDVTSVGHFGLAGMKERAETIGAEFHVTSELGKGTSIFVKGPLVGKNLK